MGARASTSEPALKSRVGAGAEGRSPGPHRPPQSLSRVTLGQCHPFKYRFGQKVRLGFSVTSEPPPVCLLG